MSVDLSYLTSFEELEDPTELLTADAQTFPSILLEHPQIKELNGHPIFSSKYNCESWPVQNLDSFYFIPLYVNAVSHIAYFTPYTGQEVSAPDCMSLDGLRPVRPLPYNGGTITQCDGCPLFGYGSGSKCHKKGKLIGLAEIEGQLYPFKKDIPGLSMKAFSRFTQALTPPIRMSDGRYQNIPHYLRYVKAHIFMRTGVRGATATWDFTVPTTVEDQRFGHSVIVTEETSYEVRPLVAATKRAIQVQTKALQLTTSKPPQIQPPPQIPSTRTQTEAVTTQEVELLRIEEQEALY